MKKKRVISIKEPSLRRVRNSLRSILVRIVSQEIVKIISQQDDLLLDRNRFPFESSLSRQQEVQELEKEKWKLRSTLNDSICICPVCHKSDRDMIY